MATIIQTIQKASNQVFKNSKSIAGNWILASPKYAPLLMNKKRGRPRKYKVGELQLCTMRMAEYELPCEVCKKTAYKVFWAYPDNTNQQWVVVCSVDCKTMWLFKEGMA